MITARVVVFAAVLVTNAVYALVSDKSKHFDTNHAVMTVDTMT